MLGQLIIREMKDTSFFKEKGFKRYLSVIVNFVVLALFIGIEIIIYSSIFDKVDVFDKFNDSLLIIINFAFLVFGIIAMIPITMKTFFGNNKEKIILGTAPVSIYEIIIAKGLKVLSRAILFALSSCFVVSCVYGYKEELDFIFYIVTFLTSLSEGLFITALAFIFTIPTHALSILIKRYNVLTVIITIVMALILAFAYGATLTMFINLIRDASLDKIFTTESVKIMSNVSKYLYPITFLINRALNIDIALNTSASFIMVSGCLFISFFMMKAYLGKFYDSSLEIPRKLKEKMINFKIRTPERALIEKELSLVFSNSDGIFSFLVLILLEPFLIYGVVSAINLIFHTGNLNYISNLYPSIYISIDVLLIMMFISVINMTSSQTLSKEKDTLVVMKTMPISFKKQLLIKIGVFFTISALSFVTTILVLAIQKEISWISFAFLLGIGLSSILILNLCSLFSDIHSKSNSNIISLLLGFALPILMVLFGVLLTLFVPNEYDEIAFLGVILVINLVVLILMIIVFDKRISKQFLKYEGVEK